MKFNIEKGMSACLLVLIIIFIGLLRNPLETFIGSDIYTIINSLQTTNSNLALRMAEIENKIASQNITNETGEGVLDAIKKKLNSTTWAPDSTLSRPEQGEQVLMGTPDSSMIKFTNENHKQVWLRKLTLSKNHLNRSSEHQQLIADFFALITLKLLFKNEGIDGFPDENPHQNDANYWWDQLIGFLERDEISNDEEKWKQIQQFLGDNSKNIFREIDIVSSEGNGFIKTGFYNILEKGNLNEWKEWHEEYKNVI